VQTPPPGIPPPWGSSPNDPREHGEHGPGAQPPAENYDEHPSYPGYGLATPSGPGSPQPGYGQQGGWSGYAAPVPSPTNQQTIGWITFVVIGLLGLLGAVLTLTLWINLSSAVNRASDMCSRFGGEYSTLCKQQIQNVVPTIPAAVVACLFLVIAAGLAASAGAVMLFLRRQMGQFLVLGGGIVMLMLSIGCEARYGATGRLTYDLIAGFMIAAVGGLLFIPAFRIMLGLPPTLTGNPAPGGSPSGGQWPYGQPPPPPHAPPGGSYPPQQW
jgi:hypothetical protein